MAKQLFDLPDELLLNILSYITNIREKIRLASVNSTFYNLVTEACRTQNYKLINHSDYMYESEYKKLENTENIIKLPELLRIAPKLTHFVDKIFHFSYDHNSDTNQQKCEPISLIHTKYIYLDLCKANFFGRPYDNFDRKAEIILGNIPNVTTLDIRMDKEYKLNFPSMVNLKVFKFSYFATNGFQLHPFPSKIVDDVLRNAPNLEEIYINSKYITVDPNLPEFLAKLSTNCPNLRALKIFYQVTDFGRLRSFFEPFDFNDGHKLLKLEYLNFTGFYIPIDLWESLLSLTPNLKYLLFDSSIDLRIKSLITRNCPRAKYDQERPFEIEEEFRIYNQRTYGFDGDRYL
ncbi:uncharacterized protein LOC128386544 [Panonychus citri]|uniref:uncharacterized protein LOC128386544 n=1 Tax=Panonychus citri TaxID=50023 RepID=UPI00230790C3|nr:uncharacterized protein LOC128386544 [Panonychus citri]